MKNKADQLKQHMAILLADDDPQVCSAMRLILEQEFEVRVIGEAFDGDSLLALLLGNWPQTNNGGGKRTIESEKESQYYVLLLDWELPDFKPGEQIPYLQANFPGLIVVALSVQTEAKQIALASGVDAFVSKSDPPDQVMAKLHALVPQNQSLEQ